MVISSEYFVYINVVIVAIYVVFAIRGYKNGLALQVVDLIYNVLAIVAAWFISPILAAHFPLVKLDEVYTALNFNVLIDTLIYCVIVFLVLKLIYMFIKPIFKGVTKLPIIGFVNKVGGFLFGLINATVVVLLLSMLLNTPMFSNGKEVKDNTYLKYCNNLSAKAMEVTLKHVNLDSIKDTIDNFDVDKSREELEKWLTAQGIFND